MDELMTFTPQTSISDILARWPHVIPLFLRHHMACVGCGMSTFETLGDALHIYNIDQKAFITELNQLISDPSVI